MPGSTGEWNDKLVALFLVHSFHDLVKVLINRGVVALLPVLKDIGPTDFGMHDAQGGHCVAHDKSCHVRQCM